MKKLAINGGEPVVGKKFKWFEWPVFDSSDEKILKEVLQGRRWCRIYKGSWTEKFEKEWAGFHDAKYCIAVSNGTVSLELIMKTLGIKPGDEVIVPAITFIATVSAVSELQAIPVFADVEKDTCQIDASSIEEKITEKTKAIIGVHYGGYPFNIDKVKEICKKYNLYLIEDAAHAHGTEWKGKKVGSFGNFGSFSFQESKSLTSGEGGAVITNDEDLYQQARLIHNIGRVLGEPDYLHYILSSNYRLSEFQSALLLSQLNRLPDQIIIKEKNGEFLKEELEKLGLLPLKKDERITQRGYYFMVLRYQKEEFSGLERDKFLQALRAEGIPVGKGYGIPLYKNPCFKKEFLSKVYQKDILEILPNYENLYLPNSEKICEEQITIPHYILLSSKEKLSLIVEAVKKIKENIKELKEEE